MDFGWAINALKAGNKVTRKGWNGKGMYLWLMPATTVKAEWCKEPVLKKLAEDNGGEISCLGTIRMYTHDSTGRNAVLTGWLASQSDMLAEDWDYACVSPEDEQRSCADVAECNRKEAFLKDLDKELDKLPKAGGMENCEKLSKVINQLLDEVACMPTLNAYVELGPNDKELTITIREEGPTGGSEPVHVQVGCTFRVTRHSTPVCGSAAADQMDMDMMGISNRSLKK
jgi:hypothetical protein